MSKLKKGQFLYFVGPKRLEQIKKSSNNKETGFIRTFHDGQNREKEYSVNYVIQNIINNDIQLFEEDVMTEEKVLELCQQ